MSSDSLVTVIHGANDGAYPVAGYSIAAVKTALADAFNIPYNAIAFVNGIEFSDTHVLSNFDVLEFILQSGCKSGRSGR